MIPFYLITGYLGSGKTSFLQHVLDEYSEEKRLAIIQNEFAPGSFDGKELKRQGDDFKLVEINNGSVFCVCRMGSFIHSMEKLINDYSPEAIFLEASGLADPVNIIELLQDESIRGKISLAEVITIVDAPNFFRVLHAIKRFKHQVMIADTIIINKMEIFSGEIQAIYDEIKALNPFARIVETSFSKIPFRFDPLPGTEHQAAERFTGTPSEGRPDVHVSVLRTYDRIAPEKLQAFLSEIQQDCPRIKGYLKLSDGSAVAIQTVFNEVSILNIDEQSGPAELIAFSDTLDLKSLTQLFKKYVQ